MSGFAWKAHVYWEDTDGGGIVYYANYLKFLERARTEWLRSFGHAQSQLINKDGIAFAVAHVEIDYRKPARLDDELIITCIPERVGGTTVNFKQKIYRGTADDLVARAQVRIVCINTRTLRPTRLPAFLTQNVLTQEILPHMNSDLSIIRLIGEASIAVQIVLAILIVASVYSWAIIFRKRMTLGRARREADQFESTFWSGGDLSQLYRGIESRGGATGMSSIFEFGFREFARQRQHANAPPDQLLEGARRAMRVAQLKEIDRLEQSLATLATVGSTSPYVGLFGTVWGIMSAFSGLGNVQQATLAMVAPGISEALVATALGLFAAIPAVVAFNRYADQVGRLEVRYDAFTEEFSTILQRHATSRGGTAMQGA